MLPPSSSSSAAAQTTPTKAVQGTKGGASQPARRGQGALTPLLRKRALALEVARLYQRRRRRRPMVAALQLTKFLRSQCLVHLPINFNTYSTSETLYQRVRRQSAQRVRRRKGARRVFQRRPGACNCVGDAPAHAPHWPADGRQPVRSTPGRAIATRRLSIWAPRAGWRRWRHGALLTERCAPRRRGDAHSGLPSPAVPARNPNPLSARQTNTSRRFAPARRAARATHDAGGRLFQTS